MTPDEAAGTRALAERLVTLTPEQRDAFAAMEAGMATLRRTFAGSTTTRAQADKIQDEALTLVGLVMKVWEASR